MMLTTCVHLNQQPWHSPVPTLILLPKCKTLTDINQIHARLITTGMIKDAPLTTKLILSLSHSPREPLIDFARYIFLTHHAFQAIEEQGDPNPDPFLWNAVIKTYSHGQDPKEAISIFCLMLDSGVLVDKFTLSLILKACSRVGLVREGMQVHGLLRKMELESNLFLQNCLVSFYIKCRCVEYARQLFDRMSERDSISYNSMIHGYVTSGRVDLARELFDCMPVEQRNVVSWNSMISGYAHSENGVQVAWELFEKMPERDLISWNSMLDGFVKCGRMEDAKALFDRMPRRDMVSWAIMIDGYAKLGRIDVSICLFDEMPDRDVAVCNAMMGGYVRNGYCTEALDIFQGMQRESKLLPDNATLLVALSAVAQLGNIDRGVAIHCYIQGNGFSSEGKLGVALIDMYSKCGSIENAILVFGDVKEKAVDHWNAMIGGLAIHGFGELAFDFFIEMERVGLKPDDITFIGLLNACGHAGMVKEGILCFELMRRVHKLEPKLQHYGCMVDILGRAGQIKEARKFVEEMPIEPNEVIWRTLLSACKTHENFHIGEPVADHLIRQDSSNSSSYVLLSNMYAGLGLWNDAREVRAMMKTRNLKKIPGCSRIELEGVVHEFLVLDKSHPQVKEIYSLLDDLSIPNSETSYCSTHG